MKKKPYRVRPETSKGIVGIQKEHPRIRLGETETVYPTIKERLIGARGGNGRVKERTGWKKKK